MNLHTVNVFQEEDADEDTLTTDTLGPEANESHSSDSQVSMLSALTERLIFPHESDRKMQFMTSK